MLKQRRDAARALANQLFEAEAAIDMAITKMAGLAGYMPTARNAAKLSAAVGQDALVQAGRTLAALVEARGKIVETHRRLANARDQIGLRELAFGGGGNKPEFLQAETGLKLVDDAI